MATDNDAFLAQIINRGDADLAQEAADHKAEHLQRAVKAFSRNTARANSGEIDPVEFADYQEAFRPGGSPSSAPSAGSTTSAPAPTETQSPQEAVREQREVTRLRAEVTGLNAENERLVKAHNAALEERDRLHQEEITRLNEEHARALAEATKAPEKPADEPKPEAPKPAPPAKPADTTKELTVLRDISTKIAPALSAIDTAYPASAIPGGPGSLHPEDQILSKASFDQVSKSLADVVDALEASPLDTSE